MLVCLCASSAAHGNTVQDFASAQAAEQAAFERRVAPLKAAGIDINSTADVMRALTTGTTSVELAAAYLLKRNRVVAAVPQLRTLLADESKPPLLTLEACGAVADLAPADAAWKGPCARLLATTNDTFIRIRAAGLFAANRDARGWDLVKEKIGAQGADLEEAAAVAHFFDGLPLPASDNRGGVIQVLPLLAASFVNATDTGQLTLVAAITRTAKPKDADVVSALAASAKTLYAKGSLENVAAKLRRDV